MPSKKRKYNARFPAGRIKKIMQTDEEVGKVAQAVPIIISRTLELFVESLLGKAMQVTIARNAKTLSPSHVKQCILAESRFDFLRDLVKNIPDVSAAEDKDPLSAESSPNSSRFSDVSVSRRIAREDSNSSSSCDVKAPPTPLKRSQSTETEPPSKLSRIDEERPTTSNDVAIDLSKKPEENLPIVPKKPVRTANFYQETLVIDEPSHTSVITVNPTYSSPQPSTSYTNVASRPHIPKIDIPVPKLTYERQNSLRTPITPITPVINIDFSKNLTNPEIKVIETPPIAVPKVERVKSLSRQNSKPKIEVKKVEMKAPVVNRPPPLDIDRLNSGNLQIDEDYDT